MDKQEYDFFRKLDLGSCEIRSTGDGKDLSTCETKTREP